MKERADWEVRNRLFQFFVDSHVDAQQLIRDDNLKYVEKNQWPPKEYLAEVEAWEKRQKGKANIFGRLFSIKS